ncbi:hypothetical protein [Streptomyces sp. TP-A0356]|uniref:hypothetical protein n=1 Tax=Streptomyces sp. TP-A0356 TaxID=1359208 RepID=UPI0006E1FCDB|nr:hypothetical protein [Streptomyces sp. TP-A0356]
MPRIHGFAIATGAAMTAATMTLLSSPPSGAAAPAQTGGGPSAQQLAAQARAGLQKARSVHLGYADRGAQATTSRTLPTAMDLSLDQGGDCTGTLTMGGHGGTVQIVKRGTDVWLKPDAAYWKAELAGNRSSSTTASFQNRYIHGTTSSGLLSGIASACDLKSLQQVATGGPALPSSLKKGARTALGGTPVIPLSFRGNGLTSTLYVTADPTHHLYRAAQQGPGTDLALTFTGYDRPVVLKIPPANQTVDISTVQAQLTGG